MNSPKVRDEDYINFIIATPRTVTATEAASCLTERTDAPAHDTFTRLLSRLEPDAEVLWSEAKTQIDLPTGILVLDDSTLEKPYSPFNALVYRHLVGQAKGGHRGHQFDYFVGSSALLVQIWDFKQSSAKFLKFEIFRIDAELSL